MASLPNQPLDKALTAYAGSLPRQARLIRLAGQVLQQLAQVKAALPPAPPPDLEKAALALAAGTPVPGRIQVPEALFRAALGHILQIFQEAELLPPLAPEAVVQILALPPDAWLDQPEQVAPVCEGAAAPAGLFLFLARQALSPFFQQAAAPYANLYEKGVWGRGVCPGCGQEPSLASLAPHSGQKLLYCGLCAAQWPYPRLACPFCGQAQPRYAYFFLEDDPARRADLCQTCRRHLKTIVADRLPHLLYLPLEEFVTVDLDALLSREDLPL